jgi:transposase-like protein
MNEGNNKSDIKKPETLIEAVRLFADEDVALRFMVSLRWFEKVFCPRCGSERVRFIGTRRVWECRETHPQKRFSIKTGTVMEESPLLLGHWLVAMWLEANAKNSISSYEVHRALGITQKSAWFMQQRIRLAMQKGSFEMPMSGIVEADETFVGGLAKNMHKKRREQVITGTGGSNKTAVMGLLARHSDKCSQVRATVVPNTKRETLHGIIQTHVEPGSTIYTDAWQAYRQLGPAYFHDFVDHAETYVKGAVHTNGLENFWSLFKRCIKGTHLNVEPFHLFRYVDSESYRFNNRDGIDGTRFIVVLKGARGKRLTYKGLIGQPNLELLS